jgi:hypothetical protein
MVRDRARRKRRPFTISLAYFRQLVDGTDYVAKKGRSGGCLQIDRVDPLLGYVPGNLRVLPAQENQSKGSTTDREALRCACREHVADTDADQDDDADFDPFEAWVPPDRLPF